MKYLSLLGWIGFAHTGLAQVSQGEVWAALPPSVRIIGLGESSHGFETFNAQKAEWINDFQAADVKRGVIFESSFTLAALAYLEGDESQRVSGFLYPFWNTNSVQVALRGYQIAEDAGGPKLFGCDVQEDCRYTALSAYLIKNGLTRYTALLKEADEALDPIIGPDPTQKTLEEKTAARLHATYAAVQLELDKNDLLPETQHRLLDRALQNRRWLCSYLTLKDVSKRMALRDSLMAENVFWIYHTFLEDTQTVLWAANSHVNKQLTGRMGAYLSTHFAADYAAVGVFPGKEAPELKKGPEGFDASVKLPNPVSIPPEQWKTPCGN